jgi:hypothetical protein
VREPGQRGSPCRRRATHVLTKICILAKSLDVLVAGRQGRGERGASARPWPAGRGRGQGGGRRHRKILGQARIRRILASAGVRARRGRPSSCRDLAQRQASPRSLTDPPVSWLAGQRRLFLVHHGDGRCCCIAELVDIEEIALSVPRAGLVADPTPAAAAARSEASTAVPRRAVRLASDTAAACIRTAAGVVTGRGPRRRPS